MPRPGPRRGLKAIRVSDEGDQAIQDLADVEAGGNWSEMARRLLSEALAARAAKASTASVRTRGVRPAGQRAQKAK
jgi:hypothetical protein